MLNSFRKLWTQNPGRSVQSLVFFVLFYLYLWLDIEPRLIYHGGGFITNFPVFYRDWGFFAKFMTYPGGLIEYTSAFLAQFFYYNWTGALVITLQAWLICVCIDNILRAVNGGRLYFVRYLAPLFLLVIYTQYTYYFNLTMGLLTGLVFICLYQKIRPEKPLLRLAVFLVLSVILYYLAGGPYIIFAVFCGIYELLFRRRAAGLVYLLCAVVVPYVTGFIVLDVSIVDAFANLSPLSWKLQVYPYQQKMVSMVYALFLLAPVAGLLLGLWRLAFRLPALPPNKPCKKRNKRKQHQGHFESEAGILARCLQSDKLKWTVKSLALYLIAGMVVVFYHNSKAKALFAVDYYAYHKKWSDVLKAARGYPNSYFVVHSVTRALYHTGRLGHDMFSYPQHDNVLFLANEENRLAYWKKIDIYLDLGFLNVAEHCLAEALTKYEEHPSILKRLAVINLAKDNVGAAKIYMKKLGTTLFETKWANDYLKRIESDPTLFKDEYIRHLESMKTKNDYDSTNSANEDILLDLLANNKKNQMAFEYLMALYLTGNQLEKVIENLHRLDDFGYSQLPPLYEEAILVYTGRTKMPVDLHGRQISAESRRRYNNFMKIYYRTNPQMAMGTLAKEYGDSYLFYYLAGIFGLKQ